MDITDIANQDIQSLERDIKTLLKNIEINEPVTEAEQSYFLSLQKSDLYALVKIACDKADNLDRELAYKGFDPNNETQMSEVKKLYSIAYRYMRLVAKYHPNEKDRYTALFRSVLLASYAHLYQVAVDDSEELIKSPHFTKSDSYQLRHNVHFQLALINTNQ